MWTAAMNGDELGGCPYPKLLDYSLAYGNRFLQRMEALGIYAHDWWSVAPCPECLAAVG